MYFIRDHHEGIIDRATFDAVQDMIAKRRKTHKKTTGPRIKHPFTGKIICGNCGKKLRRKTTHGRISWQCGTFLDLGKDYCGAKQIPENVLIDLCRDTLSLKQFDEMDFDKRIKEIRIPQPNHLLIIFQDQSEMARSWQDRSRKDSWTDEMRQKARKQYQQRRDSENWKPE